MAGKQQKGRKIGRNRERPSAKAYAITKRWLTNKAKRAKKHTRRMARKAIHRIQYDARTQRRHLHSSEAERIVQLRQVIAQNH